MEEQPTAAVSPSPVPKQSPRPKRWHPSPDAMESMCMGRTTPKSTLGGLPNPKRWETPPWFKTLKPSYTEAFSSDSYMVKESRREFFLKHSYNFTTDNTRDLSGTFRCLAVSVNLLGTSIYEIQSSWTRPELKQTMWANTICHMFGMRFWLTPQNSNWSKMTLWLFHLPLAITSATSHHPALAMTSATWQ